MVYKPEPNAPTYWNLQSGKRAAVLEFHDNGVPKEITVSWMKERYGDPTAVTGLAFSEHRFPLDAQKGIVGALIAAAAKAGLHGISLPSDSMVAQVQQMDIVATLTPDGEGSSIFHELDLDTSGYSQDPRDPQLVSLPNPPFGIGKFPMGGKRFYQLNVFPLSPDAFRLKIGMDVKAWLAGMTDMEREGITNRGTPLALTQAITPPPAPPPSGPTTPTSPALKEAVENVRRALPAPGKGGAPLQNLAGEVRKLLGVIDTLKGA